MPIKPNIYIRSEINDSEDDIKQKVVNKKVKHQYSYHHWNNCILFIKYSLIGLTFSEPDAGDVPGVHRPGAPRGQPHHLCGLEDDSKHKDQRDLEEEM